MALSKLPADVGDENGETVIDERKIRIKPLPQKKVSKESKPAKAPVDLPVSDVGSVRRLVNFNLLQDFYIYLCFFLDFSVRYAMYKYLNVHYHSKHR